MSSRISVEAVADRLARGEDLWFVDTRNSKAWASSAEQLPGARRIALDEAERAAETLPRGRAIVTYCT